MSFAMTTRACNLRPSTIALHGGRVPLAFLRGSKRTFKQPPSSYAVSLDDLGKHAELRRQKSKFAHLPPIVINGAGPAGLILAQMLKVSQIPFEICERDYEATSDFLDQGTSLDDERSEQRHWRRRTSKDYRAVLEPSTLRLLLQELGISWTDTRHFLKRVAATPIDIPPGEVAEFITRPFEMKMKEFIYYLTQGLKVNYSHNLHSEGIMREGDNDHELFKYVTEATTFEGRMLVGADGRLSQVRIREKGSWPSKDQFFSYPLLAIRTYFSLPRSLYEKEIAPFLSPSLLSASFQLPNSSFRLTLEVRGTTQYATWMAFHVCRPSTSPEDYQDFYGMSQKQTDQAFIGEYYQDTVCRDIDKSLPLPQPFNFVHTFCRQTHPRTLRVPSNGVIMEEEDLPTKVSVGDVSMPAVLMGNAAHFMPEIHANDEINEVICDAIELSKLIRAAGEDDSLLQRVPEIFYKRSVPLWNRYKQDWENRIARLYGLEPGKLQWTRVKSSIRRPRPAPSPLRRTRDADFDFGSGNDVEAFHLHMDRVTTRWETAETIRRERLEYRSSVGGKILRKSKEAHPQGDQSGETGVVDTETVKAETSETGAGETAVGEKELEKKHEKKLILKYVDSWF